MRRGVLLAVLVCTGVAVWAGELGTRLELGDRASGVAWLSLSGDLGSLRLSGRAEGDLLCGCLRRLQGGASTSWGGMNAGVEAVVLSTGRLDLSVTASWKAVTRTDFGLVSAQAGGKATMVDPFRAQFLTLAGWALARLDRDPWWVEGNANVAWPGGTPHAELRAGLAGPVWCTLSASQSGTSLELGAESGGWLVQTYLSFRPAFQTVTVGVRAGGVRVQIRLTVRAEGELSGGLTVAANAAPWSGSVAVGVAGAAVDKVSAEVRYAIGE